MNGIHGITFFGALTTPEQLLTEVVDAIEARLETVLPATSTLSERLIEGLRYSVLGGGKRIRGSLVCATSHALTGGYETSLDSACALECLHAYSLVHDDLPSMDDADLRRGKPSCHRVFGEGMATLVGDALQPFAFELLARSFADRPAAGLEVVRLAAAAVGHQGMVGGQAWDIALGPSSTLNTEELAGLHRAKTGELFRIAVLIGYFCAGFEDDRVRQGLASFARLIGEAFQVVDDVLDVTESTNKLGKPAQSDVAHGKRTLPVLIGVDASRARALELLDQAVSELATLNLERSLLAEIAKRSVERVC